MSPEQAVLPTLILFWHVPMQVFPFQLHSHHPGTIPTSSGVISGVLVRGHCFVLEKGEEEVHQHQAPVRSYLTATP